MEADVEGGGKDGGLKDVNFEEILDIFKAKNRRVRFTRSINMYWCYYKCIQAHMIVKYLYVLPIVQWQGFIQNLRETPSCLGACPVKIMILEVRFSLTNFDSKSLKPCIRH